MGKGARVLGPTPVPGEDGALLAVASTTGRLLVCPAAEIPELARGRGNKLFGIEAKKFARGDESLVGAVVLAPGKPLKVVSGKRTMTLKARDLEEYAGERGRRGKMLPRGWRKVDALAAEDEGA